MPNHYILEVLSPPPPAIQKPNQKDYLLEYNEATKSIAYTREPLSAKKFRTYQEALAFANERSIAEVYVVSFDTVKYIQEMKRIVDTASEPLPAPTRPTPEADAEVHLGDLKDYESNPELEEMEATVAEDGIPHYYLGLRVYYTYHEKADYGGFSVWVPQSWFDKSFASYTPQELHDRIQEYCYEEDPECMDDYESSFGDGTCVRDVSDEGFTLQAVWWERHATEQEISTEKKPFVNECIYVEPDKKPSIEGGILSSSLLEDLKVAEKGLREYSTGVWDGMEGIDAIANDLEKIILALGHTTYEPDEPYADEEEKEERDHDHP